MDEDEEKLLEAFFSRDARPQRTLADIIVEKIKEKDQVSSVFNNGGDRRNPIDITGPYKDDPVPTSFVPGAAYHVLIEAFGGKGYLVGTPDELKSALTESFSA